MARNGSDHDDTAGAGKTDPPSNDESGQPRHATWEKRLSEARARRAEVLQTRMEEVRRESSGDDNKHPTAPRASGRQPARPGPAIARPDRDRPLTLAAAQSGRTQPQVSTPATHPDVADHPPQHAGSRWVTIAGLVLVVTVAVGFGAIVLLRGTDVTLAGMPGMGAIGRDDAAPASGTTGSVGGEMPTRNDSGRLGGNADASADPVRSVATRGPGMPDLGSPGNDRPPTIMARSSAQISDTAPQPPSVIAAAPPPATGPAEPPLAPPPQTAPDTSNGPAPLTAPAPAQRP